MRLSNYLKQIRDNTGLEQESFSKPLKITAAQWSRIERGKSLPGEIVIQRLAQVYRADAEYIKSEVAKTKSSRIFSKIGIKQYETRSTPNIQVEHHEKGEQLLLNLYRSAPDKEAILMTVSALVEAQKKRKGLKNE